MQDLIDTSLRLGFSMSEAEALVQAGHRSWRLLKLPREYSLPKPVIEAHAFIGSRPAWSMLKEPWRDLIETLWPLSTFLMSRWRPAQRACVVLVGPPGSGKSTLAQQLRDLLEWHNRRLLICSSDDFYLSREQRQARGMRWRGVDGCWDSPRFQALLDGYHQGQQPLSCPRFDFSLDDLGQAHIEEQRPDLLMLEGLLAAPLFESVEILGPSVHIAIDMPLEASRQGRFERERRLREAQSGSQLLSEADMERFWREALAPSVRRFVQPVVEWAPLVLSKSATHEPFRLQQVRSLDRS